MKILITGMNKNQCTKDFYLQQQLEVVPSHYSLIRCLEDMGHIVEQRIVNLGEDLSSYDKVIIFLAGARQFVNGMLYNALYAISKKQDCIIAFDDWQTEGILKSIEKCKDDKELFNDFIFNNYYDKKVNKEDIIKFKDDYKKAIDIILSKKNRVLISAFKGGDLTKLIDWPKDLLFSYNPNPYHLNRKPSKEIPFKNKIKMFNFASLVQSSTQSWLKRQKIKEWNVEFFGNLKLKQRRLKEQEMVEVYNEQLACLMPGYKHSGSGWWRARPLQIADCNSILIGDFKELMIYYNDKKLSSIKANEIEFIYNDIELEEIAKKQKEAIYKNHPLDKNIQKEELKLALNI